MLKTTLHPEVREGPSGSFWWCIKNIQEHKYDDHHAIESRRHFPTREEAHKHLLLSLRACLERAKEIKL